MRRLGKLATMVAVLVLGFGHPAYAASPSAPYSQWTSNATLAWGKFQWLSMQVEPTPTLGQVNPAYFFSHQMTIDNGEGGYIGLQKDSSGKRAIFSMWGATGAECSNVPGAVCQTFTNECGQPPGVVCGYQTVVPYNWSAPNNYATYVVRLEADRWGGYIYDQTANTWTLVGVVRVPSHWNDFGWWSTSWIEWYAPHPTQCSQYPDANVYWYPPYSYLQAHYSGDPNAWATASPFGDHTSAGDCPAAVLNDIPPWKHHIMGT